MKRFLMLAVALFSAPVLAQSSQPLTVVSGAIKTIPAGNALQIPSMSGAGARCVQANATGVLTVTAGACATGGSGSVTSVAVSGGTTGITVSGSPVTTSGTITLGGTVAVASGGTGGTSAAGARTNLGVVIGTDVQAFSSNLGAYAGGDTPSAFTLGIVDSVDAAAWRSAIGVGAGTGTVTSVDLSGGTTGLTASGGPVTTSGTITLGGTLAVANGGTGAATLTGYVKGAGTSALTASASVPGSDVSGNIAGNAANVTGTVAVANGGTASTTASAARTALGVAVGSDVQAYSAKLAAYAGGDTPSAFTLGIVDAVDAAGWRTAIGAGTSSTTGTVTSVAALTLGTSGTDLGSSVANGTTTPVITLNVPTASASNRGALSSGDWSTFNGKQAALVSGSSIKTVGGVSLLGSGDVGTIGLAYGGTGATSAATARTALGAAGSATTITAGTGLTGGGDLTANRTLTIADTTVGAASYGSATSVPSFTVNAQGQLTAAANNAIPALASGTYTPTITAVANVASSSIPGLIRYQRVGNTVTVSGWIAITPTAANIATDATFTLPIASALTNAQQVSGSGVAISGSPTVYAPCFIYSDSAALSARILFTPINNSSQNISFVLNYQIL